MRSEELAKLLHGRRIGRGKWMAKCCAHPDKTASLSITSMPTGNTRVHCFGGCHQADIIRAIGLTWKDLKSQQEDSEAWKEAAKARKAEEAKEYRGRIRNWIILFKNEGYTTLKQDHDAALATAKIMAIEGSKPHLVRLLMTSMERIIASQFLER